jgi:hypothetical protein
MMQRSLPVMASEAKQSIFRIPNPSVSPVMPAHAGIHAFRTTTRKARPSFLKKSRKKLLLITASERPQYGRSNAAVSKSFLVTFFQKSNCLLPPSLKAPSLPC